MKTQYKHIRLEMGVFERIECVASVQGRKSQDVVRQIIAEGLSQYEKKLFSENNNVVKTDI